ncbi:AraC-type DNA-binding protein [Paenibacillus sp. 1_12]|uniref:helix-turn-helix domain-containing protein n=1 Tax=Paenibacillus sp. 1_12 TaxID=1566278 RepID=UPI0008F373F4|nr:helix-turn-helix domain-containing protein [Paenibacillus sp. 1_12]SFL55444.1 AraC-type DNA-binding protein [Paenibacillus sp. 1_12]
MFNKMLVSYITIIVVLVLAAGSSYLMIVSHDVKSEIEQASHDQMSRMLRHTDSLIESVEQLSLQIALKPDMNTALTNPYPLSILQFGSLKDQIKEEVSANNLLYSIYLYFRLGDRILTTNEGLYSLDRFFDRQMITMSFASHSSKGYQVRRLYDSSQNDPVDLITFHRLVPLTAKEPLGELILNVKRQAFFDALFHYTNADNGQMVIVDNESMAVLSSSDPENRSFTESLQILVSGHQLSGKSGMIQQQWNGKPYLLSYVRSDHMPWMVVNRIPYYVYQDALNAKLHHVLQIAGAVILIGMVLACLFSIRFTRPWKNIVKEYIQPQGINITRKDESELIAEAIRELVQENRSIKHTLEQSEPIIRYRLIYDILTNRVLETSVMTNRLQHLGIVFPHSYYAAVIVQADMQAYEEQDDYNEIRLLLFSVIENELKKRFFVVGTILENHHLGFILNVPEAEYLDKLKQELHACCREAGHIGQDNFGITLQTSFGGIYPEMNFLNKSYHEAKQAAHHTAWTRHADCIFFDDSVDWGKWSYPLTIQKELLQRLKSVDRDLVKLCLDDLFDRYMVSKAYTRDAVQDTVTLMMGAIVQELYEDGYSLDKVHLRFQSVSECTHIGQVKELFYSYITDIMNLLEQFQDKSQSNTFVGKAIEYMQAQYDRIESISEVAEHVGVSSSYLSRMFRTETGKAPLDYLTRLRIDKSKELLFFGDCKYSLQEICGQIGYHDVQSFIRFFKKWENMTPGEYRKLQLEKGGAL